MSKRTFPCLLKDFHLNTKWSLHCASSCIQRFRGTDQMTHHQMPSSAHLPALNLAWYRAGRNSSLPKTKYRLEHWNLEISYYLMLEAGLGYSGN
jgi:hypothetical protein